MHNYSEGMDNLQEKKNRIISMNPEPLVGGPNALSTVQTENERLRSALKTARRAREELLTSRSWKVTAPLRWLSQILSGGLRRVRSIIRPNPVGQPERRSLLPIVTKPIWHSDASSFTNEPSLHSSTFNSARPYPYADAESMRILAREFREAQAGRAHGNTVAVYTANCGSHDALNLPEYLDPSFDYFMYTDHAVPDLGMHNMRSISYVSSDPTRSARFVKMHPHWLLEGYQVAVWLDGSIVIRGDIGPAIQEFIESGKSIAVIPHPIRNSAIVEAHESIRRSKDDRKTILSQLARYEAEGAAPALLAESGFMMFRLDHPIVSTFLNVWWAELNRGSKRDQISFGYAAEKSGISIFRLTEPPNSVRNHPSLALLAHQGDTARLDALKRVAADEFRPWQGQPYAEVRSERVEAQSDRSVDIVICVHNAIDDTQACLQSVVRQRRIEKHRIIIIDDGSASDTAKFLEHFAEQNANVVLKRHEQSHGYTRSANHGLRISTAEFVIVLNSDTIVTPYWIGKLADAVFTTPGAGIVGPMSNAASHQSMPDHESRDGNTATNQLPNGFTPDDMNAKCEEWSVEGVTPFVPLVHGFCFGIRREVIDSIGLFDEEAFPRGYGEENDYCFRAADAGFGLVIATNTYVYHAKSKSFSSVERQENMRIGRVSLYGKYGGQRVLQSVTSMERCPILVSLRQRAASLAVLDAKGP